MGASTLPQDETVMDANIKYGKERGTKQSVISWTQPSTASTASSFVLFLEGLFNPPLHPVLCFLKVHCIQLYGF
jgi:hypothetical protein